MLEMITPPFFGNPQPFALDAVNAVPNDSLLIATSSISADGANGYLTTLSDGAMTPTTLLGGAGAHMYSNEGIVIPSNSACVPVMAGNNCRIPTYPTNGNPNFSAMIYQMKSGSGLLDPSVGVDLTKPFVATSDGFLTLTVLAPTNQSQGSGQLINAANNQPLAQASAHYDTGSSDCWVQAGSCCLPVPSGTTINFSLNSQSGAPQFYAFWIPMTSQASLGQYQIGIATNNRYFADKSAGFLIVNVALSVPPLFGSSWAQGQGLVTTTSDPSSSQFANATASGYVSMAGRGAYTPFQSALVPVNRGSSWWANATLGGFETQPGAISAIWIPIS